MWYQEAGRGGVHGARPDLDTNENPLLTFDIAAAIGALTMVAIPEGKMAMPNRVPMTLNEGESAGHAAGRSLETRYEPFTMDNMLHEGRDASREKERLRDAGGREKTVYSGEGNKAS